MQVHNEISHASFWLLHKLQSEALVLRLLAFFSSPHHALHPWLLDY